MPIKAIDKNVLRDLPAEKLQLFLDKLHDSQNYRTDYVSFCRYILWRHFYLPFGKIHHDMAKHIMNLLFGDVATMVVAMARLFGKTTHFGFGVPLFAACNQTKGHIIILGNTLPDAMEKLDNIKEELENNEIIHKEYGDLTTRQFSSHRLKLKNGVWMFAKGMRGTLRGKKRGFLRPDLIIGDDLEKPELTRKVEQRNYTREWFLETVMNLGDPGYTSVIAEGTILHYDSLINNLVTGTHGEFQVKVKLPAEDGQGNSRWPEKWSNERLRMKKLIIGPQAYNKEFLCNPVSDDTSYFPMSWLEQCKDPEATFYDHRPPFCDMVLQSWDLSSVIDKKRAEARNTDYTVGYTVGIDENKNRHVLNIFRRRGLSPDDLEAAIVSQAKMFNPDIVIVEKEMNSSSYIYRLKNTTDLNIQPHITGGNKSGANGPSSIAYLFQNQKYRLPFGDDQCRPVIRDMISELYGFGYETHDDLVMALWFLELYLIDLLYEQTKQTFYIPTVIGEEEDIFSE